MKIDLVGTYRGTVEESALGVTKNGFPRWIGRLKATEKYIEAKSELEHYGLEEPGWVDWAEYDESIIAYMVLFNDTETFSAETKLQNYDQLQVALNWDGSEFNTLQDDSVVGKKVLFRVEEHEWEGNTRLEVNWIDDFEASPTRELKKIDSDTIKGLNARLSFKKKPTAAKPGKPANGKTKKSDSPKAAAPPKAKQEEKPVEEPPVEDQVEDTSEDSNTDLPNKCTQIEAWEYIQSLKEGESDVDIESAWLEACTTVNADKDEDEFTDSEWAQVRDTVVKNLALGA